MAPAKSSAPAVNRVDPPAASITAERPDATTHAGLPQSGWLTADWVKRYYSISNSTLYKWIAEKRFPAPTRIGPLAVRWSVESLRKFEASLTEDGR